MRPRRILVWSWCLFACFAIGSLSSAWNEDKPGWRIVPFLTPMGPSRPVLSIDPNGETVAFASGSIDLWDLKTEEHRKVLPFDPSALAFSPDSKNLAFAMNARQGTRDTREDWPINQIDLDGKPSGPVLEGHTKAVTSLVYTLDGRNLISCSEDLTVRRWDLGSGEELDRLEFPNTIMLNNAASLSNDGAFLAIGEWNKTHLVDTARMKIIHTFKVDEWVQCVAFSSDGKYLAASGNNLICWELKGRKLSYEIAFARSFAFSPDGKQLAVEINNKGKSVQIYEAASGIYKAELQAAVPFQDSTGKQFVQRGPTGPVQYSPDGKTLITICRKGLMLWETGKIK